MPRIDRIAIVGRGIIGSSWALVYARAGLNVRIWARGDDTAATLGRIAAMIDSLRGTGLDGDAETLKRISVHGQLCETLQDADYVQESIAENLVEKSQVFREIEAGVGVQTIIASSTSGLLPSEMAAAFAHPGRFLVVHPLTPPHLLPVTEVCPSHLTDPAVVSTVVDFLKQAGQRPLRLRAEIAGFVLNRMLGATMNELFALVDAGVLAADDVDAALTEGFGLRWSVVGPLAAMDLNAPGGVREYLDRYGGIFDQVALSRGVKPALNAAVIDTVAEALDARFAGRSRADRIAWRDRAIAEMRAHRTRLAGTTDDRG